jgi:hypothetical protein
MAYAEDLKSFVLNGTCGFDPHPGHFVTLQLICFCLTCPRSVVLIAPSGLIANQFVPCDPVATTDWYAGESN